MLSILIPVYNYDVRGLVSDLLTQITLLDDPIEICLLNDGSDSQWISSLEGLAKSDNVRLHNFISNQGRVASRKKLVELAQYNYLLFIDCDAVVVDENYIINYLNNIRNSNVVAGGHVYQDDAPQAKYRLHWEYGRKVEARSVSQRRTHPYKSFSTFNFCISKEVFIQYLRNINVQGYGHEDTVMGHIFRINNVVIKHINNPLIHNGLKDVNRFLLDVDNSVKNALKLSEIYPDIGIKVITVLDKLKYLGLSQLVLFIINRFDKIILNNLISNKPNLRYLQIYKLKTLLNLEAKKKQ